MGSNARVCGQQCTLKNKYVIACCHYFSNVVSANGNLNGRAGSAASVASPERRITRSTESLQIIKSPSLAQSMSKADEQQHEVPLAKTTYGASTRAELLEAYKQQHKVCYARSRHVVLYDRGLI